MKSYKLACTTRAGVYIETQTRTTNMTSAIEAFIYELALTHQVLMSEDVVELDLTELN